MLRSPYAWSMRATGGQYFAAPDEQGLTQVYDSIDLQWTTEEKKVEVTALFAGAAALLLFVGAALGVVGALVRAHRVAQSAADLAALAGAAALARGDGCRSVEKYIRTEAPHKHLVFVLNKVDLVPSKVAVSHFPPLPHMPPPRDPSLSQGPYPTLSRVVHS